MSTRVLAAGRYRVERVLGQGGMASVYLAHDEQLHRPVAAKVLHGGLARDQVFRERFLREARLAAGLSHPNVVQVFDAGEDDGGLYIVMEYVAGRTLADELAADGPLPPDRAVRLILQACAGLAHAHEAGLVHRDVKPHNLLVRPDGTLKVADFGIARAVEAAPLTEIGTVLGTAAYLAPEQAAGEEATAASDVYALGAVLYEALTGRTPYVFSTLAELAAKQRNEPVTPVRELVPEVPQALEDVVMRCLARNPDYRPATAGELAAGLTAASGEPTTLSLPQAPAAPRRRGHRRRGAWIVLGAGLGAIGVGLGLAATMGGRSERRTPPPPPPRVAPIAHAETAAQQARNLAAWLRRNSR